MSKSSGYINRTNCKLVVAALPLLLPIWFTAWEGLQYSESSLDALRRVASSTLTTWLVLLGFFRLPWIHRMVGTFAWMGAVAIFCLIPVMFFITGSVSTKLPALVAPIAGLLLYGWFLLRDPDLADYRQKLRSRIPNRLTLPS